ncbi:hypothetical protein KPH14_004152 [Odynerus spinipes]|uniref:Uncharacterized protein n=1 Tax=Odynerus spinipes TaxID=1348599 RepID=A0AAD9RY42_9HYME|nr:hypothetical protein KPH14_004152 [Odynerus spinipes]
MLARRCDTQPMLSPPGQANMLPSRGLHTSRTYRGKSKSNSNKDCTPTKEICRNKDDDCVDTTSCKKDKDAECYPEKVKCEPQKKKKEVQEEQVCPKSCIRGGKCIIAASKKKPAKMVYGSTECPPPKLVPPRTCPKTSPHDYSNEEPICTEKAALRKLRKDSCVPPPLPGPPTEPVSLCPCPPPPKLHPGPCPCSAFKEELKIKPSPPCPVKDKYPCCLPTYYCPPKKPCVRKLPCDMQEKNKGNKS